jgi:hypothetical protein
MPFADDVSAVAAARVGVSQHLEPRCLEAACAHVTG